MDIQESIWELMEEYGMTIDLIYKAETKGDKQTYFGQANGFYYELMYLVDLEEKIQGQNYNKDVTPGNDDEIIKLIGNLRDNIEDEKIDQEWLQDNSADLEKSLQELMADQEWMEDDLAATKKMIQEQLDSQKSYIK